MVQVFSGSEIISVAVIEQLKQNGIGVVCRNDIQSGVLAGFGILDASVVVLVSENDVEKAQKIISEMDL